jgi:hypothetical protein
MKSKKQDRYITQLEIIRLKLVQAITEIDKSIVYLKRVKK